jgi:predicted metal-binding membrane protein
MAIGRWVNHRRDQLPVLLALLALTALAWSYVIWLDARMAQPSAAMAGMPGMPGMSMSGDTLAPWTTVHFLFIFTMWAVMMVGMMTPTVTPMVLMYARIVHASAQRRLAPAVWFACGYLGAWTLFSASAALAQWGLETLALLTPRW